jgi:hypothetical protein
MTHYETEPGAADCTELRTHAAKGESHSTPRRPQQEVRMTGTEVLAPEAQAVTVTPLRLIELAAARGASIEQMQQLMDLQERHERNEARKAFVVALNAFKANPPAVLKDRQVSFGAGKTAYKHAGLDNASALIGEALAQHGLSHRWNVEQTDARIKVTCILTHSLGHSESVTMEATPDTSGSKNSIQAIGSTVSYLQRYTLFAASGIAPKNTDDDGNQGKGSHQMDESAKVDFLSAIEALTDTKEAESLWASIAAACTKAGDVAAYDELKKVMSAKVKALNAKGQQ